MGRVFDYYDDGADQDEVSMKYVTKRMMVLMVVIVILCSGCGTASFLKCLDKPNCQKIAFWGFDW